MEIDLISPNVGEKGVIREVAGSGTVVKEVVKEVVKKVIKKVVEGSGLRGQLLVAAALCVMDLLYAPFGVVYGEEVFASSLSTTCLKCWAIPVMGRSAVAPVCRLTYSMT